MNFLAPDALFQLFMLETQPIIAEHLLGLEALMTLSKHVA